MLSNRGFALVFVVITMTILITTGTILISLTVQNSNINSDTSKYIKTHYIARAQVLHAIDYMRTTAECVSINCEDVDSFFSTYNDKVLSNQIQALDLGSSKYIADIDIKIVEEYEEIVCYKIDVVVEMDEIRRAFQANVKIGWTCEELFEIQEIKEK